MNRSDEPCQALWHAGGASVIGASHIRRGAPNEDAVSVAPIQGGDNRFMIAVADGHGGEAYFRSEIGAAFAVKALSQALDWCFDELEQAQNLVQDTVKIWRQLVFAHMAENPLERPAQGPQLSPYGSTLVAVAASENQLVALQVGDGDLLLGYQDGSLRRPLLDDAGMVGEQTYSLCLDDAVEHFRTQTWQRRAGEPWPDFALVATDGVSKSFVDDAAFATVVADYRRLVSTEAELHRTLSALPGWLRDVSDKGSGDDASLCLATKFLQ